MFEIIIPIAVIKTVENNYFRINNELYSSPEFIIIRKALVSC